MLSIPVTVQADRLITGAALSTLIGCSPEREAQDEWIAASLGNGNLGWGVAGGTLTLTAGDTQIVFEAMAPWGRTYAAVAVRETGVVPAPVVADTTIRLTFTAPDRLTAQAGCNAMGFRVAIDATRLTVDDQVASTPHGLHRRPRGPRPLADHLPHRRPRLPSTTTRSPSRARAPRSCWRPCP